MKCSAKWKTMGRAECGSTDGVKSFIGTFGLHFWCRWHRENYIR